MTVIKSAGLRRFITVAVPFFAIPAAVVGGLTVFREKSYSYIIITVCALTLLLFIAGFDKRRTGSRRLALTAVFTAAAVAGRVIFSPVPGVNPITAITVLAAIYLGGEAGFTIGSFSALISNFFAGQGVWTPFQMFAWGLIGLTAGLAAKRLEGHRLRACVFTFFAGVIYSFIMDVWTVLWAYNAFVPSAYLAALASAAPVTAIYAVSNVIFTYLLFRPFSEKLGRIKLKYDI